MTVSDAPDAGRRRRERAALADALRLSRSALGVSTPNPPVGAVVLDPAGDVAGRGATEAPGGRHAEVVALDEAGGRARGGTLVVTLEPCDHHGRTGPCSTRALAAGVARVVYAVEDPNPVATGGSETLRRAGVDVARADDDEVAAAGDGPLRAWLHRQRSGRPYVTWKYAATLDGRVAAADGTSRWITGPESRHHVHGRRREVDVIVVGSGTRGADDPSLTARSVDGSPARRQPLRAVMGLTEVPPTAAVRGSDGRFRHLPTRDPVEALALLGDVQHVLVEGGPRLAGAFLAAGLVDEVEAYLAPIVLGAGRSAVEDAGVGTLAAAHGFEVRETASLGPDVYLRLTAPTRGPR
ncbi:bifunctional diaminohydroxyphosphoribosylaminopyrimidine deaminase/5-amino-6-(5-phosphoribosylamino)uracil reductase RibD [Dietzia sp. PP-33]|uniref:bifunctional diaminohydroxyphosphoribosylaminopyrimidine deaminase/5-amino-6-(5-phosphoribosylamino)uracil reductase RibD n=1 Tax=Dietzia sp. PP-33 TaxID=2957500 RepID=UPI0029B53CDD|nr:bifunctional diaminohydroxyphosphoribosylaminopyrimidine deaminase/5-amino-6-(5-phosphoribosylamino)uracil reductase RibD [Dietzia sp. PP-33]MDX2355484.1 bifunctional diaminohydroxyphosphoribosylaminopyrimidine deaminase/5-amino-6-(5-phosphoribosylamino)uracil reductase RibD [Dietzia sp. PP-33]